MKKSRIYRHGYRISVAVCMLFLFQTATAQKDTSSLDFWNDTLSKIAVPTSNENWIYFKHDVQVNAINFFKEYGPALRLSRNDDMRVHKIEKDNLGFTHYMFNQYYKNIRISGAEYIIHVNNRGFTYVANGRYVKQMNKSVFYALSRTSALRKALNHVGASKYMWQDNSLESDLKKSTKKPDTSYYPKGELIWTKKHSTENWDAVSFRLAYQFDIYAALPSYAVRIEIDANTGEIINEIPLEENCTLATISTIWNGSRTINTDLYSAPNYRLKDNCQTASIRVRDWNNTKDELVNPLEITSGNNTWTTNNQRFGGSVLWAIKSSYDYYKSEFSRNSYDDNNGIVEAYINAVFTDPQTGAIYTDNASMSKTGGIMKVGLGSSGTLSNSFGTIDIIGHEYTHAVTGASAQLDYADEAGALNEGYSDIFGCMVQWYATGVLDYLMGEDRSDGAIRSLKTPNLYKQPDTYKGKYWYSGTSDNGGVHTNSGVLNYWFYLLSEGGFGTNDLGSSFDVTGINAAYAMQIAYRALTAHYVLSNSTYIDARTASVNAAIDLYGSCSNEAYQTAKAWYAVGIGDPPTPLTLKICPPSGFFAGDYKSLLSLTAGGGNCIAIVNTGVPTSFTAQNITLSPGFDAQAGSNFHAYVTQPNCTLGSQLLPGGNPPRSNYVNSFETKGYDLKAEDGDFKALIYPNPAQSSAILKLYGAKCAVDIILTSPEGKVLLQRQHIMSSSIPLSIAHLPSGIYFITVIADTRYAKLKLVKN